MIHYVMGAELPPVELTLLNTDGEVIDFASGWTFEAKVGRPGYVADVTKTTGITGASSAPNVTVAWSANELSTIAAGRYKLQLRARNGSSLDRIFHVDLEIQLAVT